MFVGVRVWFVNCFSRTTGILVLSNGSAHAVVAISHNHSVTFETIFKKNYDQIRAVATMVAGVIYNKRLNYFFHILYIKIHVHLIYSLVFPRNYLTYILNDLM